MRKMTVSRVLCVVAASETIILCITVRTCTGAPVPLAWRLRLVTAAEWGRERERERERDYRERERERERE